MENVENITKDLEFTVLKVLPILQSVIERIEKLKRKHEDTQENISEVCSLYEQLDADTLEALTKLKEMTGNRITKLDTEMNAFKEEYDERLNELEEAVKCLAFERINDYGLRRDFTEKNMPPTDNLENIKNSDSIHSEWEKKIKALENDLIEIGDRVNELVPKIRSHSSAILNLFKKVGVLGVKVEDIEEVIESKIAAINFIESNELKKDVDRLKEELNLVRSEYVYMGNFKLLKAKIEKIEKLISEGKLCEQTKRGQDTSLKQVTNDDLDNELRG